MKSLYVVASYAKKPRNPKLTAKPGYMANETNIAYDEKVQIVAKVKSKDLTMCQVILDMGAKKVIKNSFRSEKSYDELIKYYTDNYDQYFRNTLGQLIPNVEAKSVPAVSPETEEAVHGATETKSDVSGQGTATN
jgi:hypothetical protein